MAGRRRPCERDPRRSRAHRPGVPWPSDVHAYQGGPTMTTAPLEHRGEDVTHLLWMDVETTSLDIQTTTVVEIAWTVTDFHGPLSMVIPLRHRFTALAGPGARQALTPDDP